MTAHCRQVASLLALLALVALVPGCDSKSLDEDTFVVLLDSSPKGLDPRLATSDASAKLIGLLHAGLVTTDTKDGDLKLDLAESIEQTSTTRYEVELRDDAYFHDGHPVTAEDVEYTFMELGSEEVGSPHAGTAERIEDFEVVDERRMVITLEKPYAPFLSDLSLGVVPRHLCEGRSECRGEPVGAGPFRFIERDGDELFVFERFDRHHGQVPHLERLAFKVVEDDNTRLLALLGEAADLVQNAVAPMLFPVVDREDNLHMETSPSFKYTYLAFNLEHPILKERKVRRAIAHAIDREAIIEHKFDGHARLSTGMIAPEHWAYEPDVPRYEYDPERARELLDEAGFADPDGKDGPQPRFELEFKVSASSFRRSLAELIGHQLKRVGIDVTVRSYEWGTLYDDIQSRNFAMTTM
ncbi:MAG: ABC transporter substrate-binding protein, partial [Persicimonas sp.]